MDNLNENRMRGIVQIVPNSDGTYFKVYNSNPKYSYVNLQSDELDIETRQNRKCILRAETALIEKFVQKFDMNNLPGRIVIKEFLEDNVPDIYKSRISKSVPWKEAIKPHIKRIDGSWIKDIVKPNPKYAAIIFKNFELDENGFQLMSKNGRYILKFYSYDPTGKEVDVKVKYDPLEFPPFIRLDHELMNYNYIGQRKEVKEKVTNPNTISTPSLEVEPTIIAEKKVIVKAEETSKPLKDMDKERPKAPKKIFIALAILICLFLIIFKPSMILLIASLAVLVFIALIIGSISNAIFDPNSDWSWIITIVVGALALYFLGSVLDGCGVSEPDSGWRRP